ncbi:MAG: tripartite tricarboxylate transporter TctB family protein [Burkholderiaceae bacterium]
MNKESGHIKIRWMELIVAAFFAGIGLLVVIDSFRTGYQWSSDGPQPGYFPFYIGCTLIVGSIVVASQTLLGWRKSENLEPFVIFDQLRLMMTILIPTCLFVLGVVLIGFYVASVFFISSFMVWQGKYSLLKAALVGLSVSGVLFLLFDIWFLIPLPTGKLNTLFGY